MSDTDTKTQLRDLKYLGINKMGESRSYPIIDHLEPNAVKTLEDFIASREAAAAQQAITENTSDGYHTFKELYEFRKLYNAALFNEWAAQGKYDVHKSHTHSDGEPAFGGGWFVVVAELPTGQITNHYEDVDWPLFQVATRSRAAEWDGHTPADVAKRLDAFARLGGSEEAT